jgi:hypothetical protein
VNELFSVFPSGGAFPCSFRHGLHPIQYSLFEEKQAEMLKNSLFLLRYSGVGGADPERETADGAGGVSPARLAFSG